MLEPWDCGIAGLRPYKWGKAAQVTSVEVALLPKAHRHPIYRGERVKAKSEGARNKKEKKIVSAIPCTGLFVREK